MTVRFWLAALFVAVLASPTRAQTPTCPQFFPGGQLPALVNPKLGQRTTMLCNTAYAVLASGITHGALWSAEHPTAASLAGARGIRREGEFHPTIVSRRPTRRSSPIIAGAGTTGVT